MGRKQKEQYEVLPVGFAPNGYPTLAVFRNAPTESRRFQAYSALALLPFFGVFAVAFGIWALVPAWRFGWPGAFIAVTAFALGLSGGTYLGMFLDRRWRRSLWTIDQQNLGPGADDERYAGVAYANGAWRYRNDTAWDRGYISIRGGVMAFRGYGPAFELPIGQITGVRIGVIAAPLARKRYLAFVDWTNPEGAAETFSIELRDCSGVPSELRLVEDYRDRLADAMQAEPEIVRRERGAPLPIRSSSREMGRLVRASDYDSRNYIVSGDASILASLVAGLVLIPVTLFVHGFYVFLVPGVIAIVGFFTFIIALYRRALRRIMANPDR